MESAAGWCQGADWNVLCGQVDIEISQNEDGTGTGVTVRQELNSSGKERSDLVGGSQCLYQRWGARCLG